MSSSRHIAIVGAGVSGLAAALELAEHGERSITIFEARRAAGGRTRSYVDPLSGDTLDNGQHLFMGCYTSALEYLDRIGSRHLLEPQQTLEIPFSVASERSLRSATLRLPASLPPPLNLLAGLLRSDLLTPREKLAAMRLGAKLRSRSFELSKDMTCADFFKREQQPRGIVRKLWEPIVLATINSSIQSASALLFVRVMREAFFTTRDASRLFFPKVGLTELLVNPAICKLTHAGVQIRLGDAVRAVRLEDERFELTTDGGVSQFDSLIWSAPVSDAIRPLLGKIELPSYSPIVNAYFWLCQELLKTPIRGFIGTTLQWAFSKPSVSSAELIALTVSGADQLVERSNEEIAQVLWKELEQSVPQARGIQLKRAQVIKEKRATPLFSPESQARRPGVRTPVNGLLLAGDIVQNGLPATIEGAIRNGTHAARVLLEQ